MPVIRPLLVGNGLRSDGQRTSGPACTDEISHPQPLLHCHHRVGDTTPLRNPPLGAPYALDARCRCALSEALTLAHTMPACQRLRRDGRYDVYNRTCSLLDHIQPEEAWGRC